MDSYHEVKTEVRSLQGTIRYTAKWYDLLSLQDFIQFLQKEKAIP